MKSYCCLKGWKPGVQEQFGPHHAFHAMFISEGEVTLVSPGREQTAPPGAFILVPYRAPWEAYTKPGFRCVAVTVREDLGAYYTGRAGVYAVTPELQRFVSVAEQELLNPGPNTQVLLRHLALTLADLILRLAHDQGGGEPKEALDRYWAERVRSSIEANLFSHRTVKEILSSFSPSYRQLRRYFQRVTGTTPKQYQLACRIRQAEQMLATTTLSLTSIALELGFSSAQHFSCQFKRATGQSPSAARKRAAAGSA